MDLLNILLNYLFQMADKYPAVSHFVMIVGLLYILLSLLRGFLTAVVKLTKTKKDDKVIQVVFAFLDKYAWGFGKFSDYYETHKKDKEASK